MIDFSKINPYISITPQWILSKVDQASIFLYYFGRFKIGNVYSSPFRKDKNPSCGFYISKTGNIMFHDFSTGEKYNCFAFVKAKMQCNFDVALRIIANDFGLIKFTTRKVTESFIKEASEIDLECKKNTIIQFVPDKWQEKHLKYWKSYEITKEELIREDVHPVKGYS